MKKRLSKKTLFPLLFLLTTLLISLRVFAGDSHDGWKEVKTREDLSNYYVSAEKAWRVLPGEYYLTADISAASRFVVSEGDVTICLNGHTLGTNDDYTFIVRAGKHLKIEACGNGSGLLENTKSTASSTVVYVAANSSLTVNSGNIYGKGGGDAITLNTGSVTLYDGVIRGIRNGVNVQSGTLKVKGGEVVGNQKGVNIESNGTAPIQITLQGGLITGLFNGIYSNSASTKSVNVNIEYGAVEAGNGNEECIHLDASSTLKIEYGRFLGKLKSGMNATATGGLFTDNTVKPYVPSGYICRRTPYLDYMYEVGYKRSYTVIFTDGKGKKLKTETVMEGESATAPPAPSRPGYIFNGWDKNFSSLSGESLTVTINAKWRSPGIIKTVADLKKVSVRRPFSGKGQIRFRWKKASKKDQKTFTKYQIQYGRKKDFSDAKTVYAKKSSSSILLKKLKRKTKYYVRIRRWKVVGKVLHVSKWKTKSVKTK